MLRPSTAPRWNRQTRIGRSEAGGGGRGREEANAARARNSGSRPKLTKARPPDFTNTRLETDISDSSQATACYRPLPPVPALLPLKLRPAERQPHRQRARRDRICHVRQLLAEHAPRVVGHRAPEDAVVHRGDEP